MRFVRGWNGNLTTRKHTLIRKKWKTYSTEFKANEMNCSIKWCKWDVHRGIIRKNKWIEVYILEKNMRSTSKKRILEFKPQNKWIKIQHWGGKKGSFKAIDMNLIWQHVWYKDEGAKKLTMSREGFQARGATLVG